MSAPKRHILVTAVGGDLAQSVIQCLGDSGTDVYLVGCDMNPYAAGQTDVDRFVQAPPVSDTTHYETFIRKRVEAEAIDYLFPLSEMEILFFNDRRNGFFPPSTTVVINEKRIIDTFSDKYLTVAFFKENGIIYPQTWLPSEEYPRRFPLILKRRKGSGSVNLFTVHDPEELHFYLARYPDLIVQEYLPECDPINGSEYTAGLFSDGNAIHTIVFRRKLAPGGFSREVELVTEERFTAFAQHMGRALRFKGSVNVQFREVDTPAGRQFVPFEINPRFSSTVYFRHLFGFKDVQWTLDALAGKPIAYTPVYRKGIGVKKSVETILFRET
ncbi:MAG: ATP-grasp domain-containing protein [Candidatus Omnitrophota bacterium]